jgi:CRP-like cAMP-binding protein
MARTLSANALFEKLSLPQLAELCWAARPFEVEAGAVLYHQGEPSDEMWCIEGGRVRLTIRMPGGAEIRHLDLGAGETTGEMAFLDGGPCPTTATALERTWGVMIPRYAFEVLRTTFSPAAYEVFRRLATMAAGQLRAIVTTRVANVTAAHHHAAYQIVAGDRAEPTKLDFDQARTPAAELDRERLLLLPAFRRFSRAELDELLGYMHMLKIDRRVSIFREGDPAESCFITVRGAVQAQIERPGWVQKLGLSGPGQMFGHVALLDAGPRSASCVSRERSRS